MSERSNFETVLRWVVVFILAIVALKLIGSVLAVAWVLGGFLLFKILPLVLLVWAGYKAWQWWGPKTGATPPADPSLDL